MSKLLLLALFVVIVAENASAQRDNDSVHVKILLDDPKEYTKLTVHGGVGFWQRQTTPSFILIAAADYDINDNFDAEGRLFLGGLIRSSEDRQIEFQIGGNYFFHEAYKKNEKSKVSLGYLWDTEHILSIELTKLYRYGARAGINYYSATYANLEYDAGLAQTIQGDSYLIGQTNLGIYVGGIYEMRQYAVLDVENYGRKIQAKKRQFYGDLIFGPANNATYTAIPAEPLDDKSIGFRLGYKEYRSLGNDKFGYGFRFEAGSMPRIQIPADSFIINGLYFGFGATFYYGVM